MASKKDILFVGGQFILFGLYLLEFNALRLWFPASVAWIHLTLAIVGLVIIIVSMLQLNKNLSPFPTPKKGAGLITGGLYGWVRHPIYSGILMLTFFLALYLNSGYKLFISLVLLLFFYYKSSYEEAGLEYKFPQYKNYKATTGRFFPNI